MDIAAYNVALLTIITIPPVLGFWFFVHPFTQLWRRLGLGYYQLFMVTYFGMFVWAMYVLREPLLRIHFGVSLPLIVCAALLLGLSIWIGVLRQRQLKTRTLMGIPQIIPGEDRGVLITEGIYSRMRNPRYLEIGFAFAAMACFCNYLAAWILLALYIPVIYVVVLMEERELRQRFGVPYENYCHSVPRFIPRLPLNPSPHR